MAVKSAATYNTYTPGGSVGGTVGAPVVPSPSQTSQTSLQRLSKANPPFTRRTAGVTPGPSVGGTSGANGKIVRGYIRRTDDTDRTDPTAGFRLNFMYNPERIERQFIAYLDQNALDPFNTVHGSGNITAPPGILDFSFELMFDRQTEVARDGNHPGTKVDYDYFDLVVRGVVPNTVSGGGSAVPDNGIMMVNPRNITVVFGPELQVTGKPFNASVSFDKHSHKMTPTRIRILLQMKVLSIGPRPLSYTYQTAQDQAVYAATVAYDDQVTAESINSGSLDAGKILRDQLGTDPFGSLGLDLGGYSSDQSGNDSPSNATSGGGSSPVPTTTGGVNAERVWKFLRSKGLTVNQTAGIMGNMQAESGFNPGIEEKTARASKGYGLCQWTFGRRTNLENYAKQAGRPSSDLDVQLGYLWSELTGPYQARVLTPIKATSTVREATSIFLLKFEVPANAGSKVDQRTGYAMAVLQNTWAK